MKDKTILITGANTGIGKATAIALAKKGAKVVIVVRNDKKAAQAANEISKESGSNAISYFAADLSSQQAVRKLALDFKSSHNRLDVLINNAGCFFSDLQWTDEKFEMQFATNHLSPFLLTNLLLDLLKASAPARIVNVSSHSHYRGKIHFGDLNLQDKYNGLVAYEQSKLCNVLFSNELARRLEGTGVTVNSLHPGVVKTEIAQKNATGIYKLAWSIIKPFMISQEQGAATSVYLASADEVKGVTGKYFAKSKEKYPSRLAQDEALAKKLWEVSAELTGV